MGRYSVTFSDKAKKDLTYLHKSGGKALVKRIERIFEELGDNPYSGIGKPEQLKNNLSYYGRGVSIRSTALFIRSLNKP
jgi:toxin YoeB